MTEPCENCGTPLFWAHVPRACDPVPVGNTPKGWTVTFYPGPVPMAWHEAIPEGSYATSGGGSAPAFSMGPEHTPQRCREARAARKVET